MAANTPVLASGLLYVLGVTALIGCGGDAGPSDTTNSVTIDAAFVRDALQETLQNEDLSRYIL